MTQSICTSHYNAVLAEYPDANMSAFRESTRRCGRCAFCRQVAKAKREREADARRAKKAVSR